MILVNLFKVKGITAMFCSLTQRKPESAAADIDVSCLKDIRLQVKRKSNGGRRVGCGQDEPAATRFAPVTNSEHNRQPYFLKSRRMPGPNPVRKFVPSSAPFSLREFISDPKGSGSVRRALPRKPSARRGPARAAGTVGSSPQHGCLSIWKASDMSKRAEDSLGYNLRLYVAGQTPKSIAAIYNLRRLCEKYLSGRYRLDVIDLMVDPNLAQRDQIIAIPTLVRHMPEQIKRVIGDLSNGKRVLTRLGIDVSAKA
jgi:circadian clock protein KaiB